MKILRTIAIAFLLVVSGSAFAQQQASSEQKAQALTSKMKEQIGFSDATNTKVYEINLDFVTKMETLRNSGGEKAEKLKGLRQISDDRDTALKAIFSEAEYKSFKEHQKENRQQMKERYQESRN